MISPERMTNHLLEIIQIDSISKNEKDVAVKLQKDMEDLGAECFFDKAGETVGGNTGNLLIKIEGNISDAPPLFLCAHMDTVVPGENIKPMINNGVVRSDGTTILGGDDKTGVSIIVEVVRTLIENKLPHGDIEIAFTICEEIGLLGAKLLDTQKFNSNYGIVLDSSTPSRLVLKCPSSDNINVKIHGIEAHAGLCPENGISAIKIASEAISNMKLGRIDYETTSNIGYINGGKAINIIPNYVELKGEARSHNEDKLKDQIKHMSNCFYNAASNYTINRADEEFKPIVDITVNRIYDKMDVSSSSRITKIIDQSVKKLGHSIVHHTSGGGCDANYINQKGIECVNLGTGMYELHTVNEYVVLNEFFRSAEIVLEAIKLNTHLD